MSIVEQTTSIGDFCKALESIAKKISTFRYSHAHEVTIRVQSWETGYRPRKEVDIWWICIWEDEKDKVHRIETENFADVVRAVMLEVS